MSEGNLSKHLLILTLSLVALAGCEMSAAPTDDGVAHFAKNIRYFRDNQNGLCFAAVESVTYSGYKVASIANVPCDKVGL